MARVLIVDDHPIVRVGYAELINRQDDLEVCGEAADTAEALGKAQSIRPDLVVVDISLKGGNGLDLIRQIKIVQPETKMLIVSAHDESLFAERGLRAGAMGYVNKEEATDRLVERLGEAFRARGADPVRQIAVIPWLSASRFLGLLEACDAYLDCPSFSGYTTAWQAVHVGIPVVTREGAFLRERLAAGLLRRIGLPETIAGSDDEYVAIAERLAAAAADAATMLARREEQRNAAGRADGDLAVVRAFEKEVLSALQAVNRAAPHAKEWR